MLESYNKLELTEMMASQWRKAERDAIIETVRLVGYDPIMHQLHPVARKILNAITRGHGNFDTSGSIRSDDHELSVDRPGASGS